MQHLGKSLRPQLVTPANPARGVGQVLGAGYWEQDWISVPVLTGITFFRRNSGAGFPTSRKDRPWTTFTLIAPYK
jgi:hypothetical protein